MTMLMKRKSHAASGDLVQIADFASQVAWLPLPSVTSRIIKRCVDVMGAAIALVLFAPLLVVVALVIKLTSSGPVLFKQTRLGFHGKPFSFLKFRTMYVDADARLHREYVSKVIADQGRTPVGPGVFKIADDPRVTPFGRFLRRTSLDELPQFVNVLLGHMSLVGPRPPLVYEVQRYEKWHRTRLSCKPGITGLWQISAPSRLTFDEMVRLDLQYIQRASLLLDMKILFKTPVVVMTSRGAF